VSEILTQVDVFTLILSIVICIISLLAYRENRSRMPLFVGIGFAILGLSYLITIISSTQSTTSLVLLIRMCAFITVLYAVYTNLGEARNQLTVLS
jgi:dipeptide/tripeptide permease